jgi:hypothetical protein
MGGCRTKHAKKIVASDLKNMVFCEDCVHFDGRGASPVYCDHPTNRKIVVDFRAWFVSHDWEPSRKNKDNDCPLFEATEE